MADIDFDAASKAWTENKIKLANGCYMYKKGSNFTKTAKQIEKEELKKKKEKEKLDKQIERRTRTQYSRDCKKQ